MLSHLLLAVTTFVITNVDDLLILTFYFSTRRYRTGAVILGQYLGIIILILISLAGLLIKEIVPHQYISLLGIFPILLGVKELLDRDREKEEGEEETIPPKLARGNGMWMVAMVTLANGGDNIGVYTPLFLKTETSFLLLYCGIFLFLTGLFCFLGYYFVNHPVTKESFTRYGNLIMPYFLIILGVWILSGIF